jgi:hypothetical protein
MEYRQGEERSDGPIVVVIAPRERFFIGGESSVVASFAVSSCTLHIFGISFVNFNSSFSSRMYYSSLSD